MNGEDYFDVLIQQARAEHRELHERVRQIRDQLKALPGASLSATTSAERCQAIRALLEYVIDHFSQEEDGGWLEEAVVQMPRLAHELTILESQHESLLMSLRQLVDELPTEAASLSAWKHIADEFEEFVRELFAHEAGEENILQAGLNQEIGL